MLGFLDLGHKVLRLLAKKNTPTHILLQKLQLGFFFF